MKAPAWHGRSAQFLTFLSLAKPKITDTRSTCAKILEDAVIPQVKRRSKLKRREAALVLGAAGVSLAMAGGASATTPTKNVPSQDDARRIVLGEEEISDVSLATFYVFDKENAGAFRPGVLRLAMGGGGGCAGCAGCGGCGCWTGTYYTSPVFGNDAYPPPRLDRPAHWHVHKKPQRT
jgi:hypothetical protein